MIFSLGACSLTSANATITTGVLEAVNSFDPQLAKTDIEKILSANCFEGLLRFDEQGKINLAGAVAYTIGNNGLSYTFKLNPDAQWYVSKDTEAILEASGIENFNSAITAEDYIYGIEKFQQLNDSLESIKAVEAVDDYTLEITLSKADYDFLYKLAALPVYPCDKAFSEKLPDIYATTPATVLTNGAYYIKEHLPSETIIERSPVHNGNVQVRNKKIVLYTTGLADAIEERFADGSYDIYTHNTSIGLREAHSTSFEGVWGLSFNCKSKLCAVQGIRYVILSSIDYESIKLPDYAISGADTIIPPDFTVGDVKYSDFALERLSYTTDKEKAKATLDTMLKKYNKESYTLTFAVPEEMEDTAKKLVKSWSEQFGEKIKIELKTFEYTQAQSFAQEGAYDFAILPLSPQCKTASGVLKSASVAPCFYESKVLTDMEKTLSTITNDNAVVFHNTEKALVEKGVFVPLFYTGTALYSAENVTGIYLADGGNLIYFHMGEKK